MKKIIIGIILGRARWLSRYLCHALVTPGCQYGWGLGLEGYSQEPQALPEDLKVNYTCAGWKLLLMTADWAQKGVARASSDWKVKASQKMRGLG